MSALKGELLCLPEIKENVKKVVYVIVVCVFSLRLSLQCCCYLFVYLSILFYTDVVAVFIMDCISPPRDLPRLAYTLRRIPNELCDLL